MSTGAAPQVALSTLVSRHAVAEGTPAFRFERLSNWTFQVGQFVEMTLLDPSETDAEGNARTFSIASGPHEPTLMVATRLRDTAFKRVLNTMPPGSAGKIDGPSGDLTLHNSGTGPVRPSSRSGTGGCPAATGSFVPFLESVKQTAVFLADGIGITPFRNMVFRAAKEEFAHRIFLCYSNRRPEDAPFLDELQALERENPNHKLVASMTEMSKSHQPWHGEAGLIDRAMLSRYLKGAVSPIYYIAVPPELVKASTP
jgi:ferredoxin-NADP reductase